MTQMLKNKASLLSLSAFLFDLFAVTAAWLTAYVIRFNGTVPADFMEGALHSLFWVLPVYGVMFRIFGLYRGMWVFASLPDLMRISKSVIAGALVTMVVSVMVQPVPIVPRSVLVVSPLLLFLVMGGTRALYRATKEFYLYGGLVGQGTPVPQARASPANCRVRASGVWLACSTTM
jgi:FlaA1/EpsC-like NDP-sugar epimerase